jgi:hypothetical protein
LYHPVRKLNLGPDDPSKPLLTLIIDRLTSGSLGSTGNQIQAQTPSVEEPKATKITKEKESIDSSLHDLKKQQDKSKDFIQQAKEAPTLNMGSHQAHTKEKETTGTKDSAKDVFGREIFEAKHDSAKLVGAKKESEPHLSQPSKEDNKKSDKNVEIPGKKFQSVPDDAMKKKQEQAAKHAHNEVDGMIL